MVTTILMRMPQVEAACGLKKSAIYQRIKTAEFPAPVSLGAKHVAWRSDHIAAWIASRPQIIISPSPEEVA
jgi:prophage regulatory protein